MYCSKCGNLLDENGACSNCDVTSSPVTVVNPVSSNGTVLQKTSLAKCAWFAPVAVVVSVLLMVLISFIQSEVYNEFNFRYGTSEYCLVTVVFMIVSFAVRMAICVLIYLIAFQKTEKKIKTENFLMCLIPHVLCELFLELAQQAYIMLLHGTSDTILSEIPFMPFVIATIFASLISYLLCYRFLSKVDISDEINFAEKVVDDASTNITCSPQASNGYIQQNVTTQKSEKSRGTAAVLCFFFGALGIHRFYVGKIGTGLLWMFTAGLFGIGAFIDFIIIICGSFKDADDRIL